MMEKETKRELDFVIYKIDFKATIVPRDKERHVIM